MQILANGIIQGIIFALMGVAFSLVYSTTRVFHVALGGIFALAPYLFLSSVQHIGAFASVVLSLCLCGCVGVICEESLHWPFSRKFAPSDVHLIGSLGMFLVIGQLIAIIWGNDTQILRSGTDKVYVFADGLRLAQAQCVGGVGGLFTLMSFFVWLNRSSLGLQFRAMADNQVLLSLMGRNVRQLRRLVFLISGMIAAIAALVSAYDVGFDPNVGLNAVLIGMIATIVGGRGSLYGTALAGLLLGVIRAEVVWYASARWEETFSFLLLAIILFFRPHGLFGRRLRLEENV
jgi:branched-chain amino acid transport system permease protein